jgi:lipopolysaccharide/colanic/teichoic acid biosynthesis glycosyltransferase
MKKRFFDVTISAIILIVFSPILVIAMLAVFFEDLKNPIYTAKRVGKNTKLFSMYKIRSMRVGADKNGVESTSSNDVRITKIGAYIRKFKIDELSQFVNVLVGDMSIVGPRPNTINEVEKYSDEEQRLLSMKPGITDIASIVFSNEGDILRLSSNPDKDYERLIRPWKSELALTYVNHNNVILDIIIMLGTAIAIFDRSRALRIMAKQLSKLQCRKELIDFTKVGLNI